MEKKKKSKLPFILLFILFLILAIFGIVYFLKIAPNSPFANIFKTKSNPIKIKPPKPVTSLAKSEKISAKKGGQINLTTPTGTNILVYIPPGSLKQDTTLTLTPLDETPLEGFSESEPGIIIDPPGINFDPAAAIAIGGQPVAGGQQNPGAGQNAGGQQNPGSQPGAGSQPGGSNAGGGSSSSDSNFNILNPQNMEDLSRLLQNINITPPPSGNQESRPQGRQIPGYAVIISTRSDGFVGLIPTNKGNDGSLGGLIKHTGTYTPYSDSKFWNNNNGDNKNSNGQEKDNNQKKDEAGKIAGQEDVNGGASGACTPEYMQAAAAAAAAASAAGDTAGAARYGQAVKDCNDQSLEYFKKMCRGDRRLVRRKDFEERMQFAEVLPGSNPQTASGLQKLMKECTGQYQLQASGINPDSSNGVEIHASLKSSVCGYVDDQWSGNYKYVLTVEGREVHVYEGSSDFRLPARGGWFYGDSKGTHRSIAPVPQIGLGFWGNFDGVVKVDLTLYAGVRESPEIKYGGNCVESSDIPPVPLPGAKGNDSGGDDLVPLVPLVPNP